MWRATRSAELPQLGWDRWTGGSNHHPSPPYLSLVVAGSIQRMVGHGARVCFFQLAFRCVLASPPRHLLANLPSTPAFLFSFLRRAAAPSVALRVRSHRRVLRTQWALWRWIGTWYRAVGVIAQNALTRPLRVLVPSFSSPRRSLFASHAVSLRSATASTAHDTSRMRGTTIGHSSRGASRAREVLDFLAGKRLGTSDMYQGKVGVRAAMRALARSYSADYNQRAARTAWRYTRRR